MTSTNTPSAETLTLADRIFEVLAEQLTSLVEAEAA